MTSLVADDGALTFTARDVHVVKFLDQGSYHAGVLKDLGGTGLVRESVDLVAHKIDGAFVLVV